MNEKIDNTVAVFGGGIMAAGIIRNLQKSNYTLRLYNRTKSKVVNYVNENTSVFDTPAEAAKNASFIISFVTNDEASDFVWFGESGAVNTALKDAVCIECSTLSIDYIDYWSKKIISFGLNPIDCPVTGSKNGADNGTLSLFVGADVTILSQARTLMEVFSKDIFHLGNVGYGMRFKLIYNILGASILVALSEALGSAKKSRLNMELVEKILSSNGWSSLVGKSKCNNIMKDEYKDVFCSLDNIAKDVMYGLKMYNKVKFNTLIGNKVMEAYNLAQGMGLGELDISAVGKIFMKQDRVEDEFQEIYLNYGASGKYFDEVLDAVNKFMSLENKYGGASTKILQEKENVLLDVRDKLSRLLNCSSNEMVVTSNTTEGVNIIANGMNFEHGDEIITTNEEHYSCIVPWNNLAKTKGIFIKQINIESLSDEQGNISKDIILEYFNSILTDKTKVIFLSHILCTTGIELPIHDICKMIKSWNPEIKIIIDGAQVVGHIDVDISNIGCDAYAFTGGKWLNAPTGTGGMYISKQLMDSINLTYCGWNSVKSEKTLEIRDEARRFEVSTRNASILFGLSKAIDIHSSQMGTKKEHQNAREMRKYFDNNQNYEVISPSNDNSIITFKHKTINCVKLNEFLVSKGVVAKIITTKDAIRFCMPNFKHIEINNLCDILEEANLFHY